MQTLKELADLCETTISADSSDIQIFRYPRSGDVDDGYLFAALPANGTVLASPPRPSPKER